MSPYFLPYESDERKILDQLFSRQRLSKSRERIEKAGFLILTAPEHAIIVARHNKLRDYIIKLYLDSSGINECYWLRRRIDGAKFVQNSINELGYQHIMKVPKKWIYPLPADPRPADGQPGKNFILLCERMDVYDFQDSRKFYSKKISKNTVDAIYTLFTHCLLTDSIYIDNVPYCKDGRIAILDTEHYLSTAHPINLAQFTHYFSREMQLYWDQLIREGGPKRN